MKLVLNRPQSIAHSLWRDAVLLVLAWGRGTGKSFCILTFAFLLVSVWDHVVREKLNGRFRGIRIAMLGPTRKQLVDIFGAQLRTALETSHTEQGWRFLGGKLNRTIWRVEFPGGSWIQFFGMDTADSARGIRCDVILTDECDDIEIAAYDSVAVPWLSEPWSFKRQLMGGTPRRGRHGLLYQRYRAGRDGADGVCSIHATYRDAPENVDVKFVERQRRLTPAAVFAREWECDFDAGEGLVYPMFSVDVHVRDPDPRAVPTETLVGVDWGFEDPGVMLVAHVYGSGADAAVHVVEEHYTSKQTISYWEGRARDIQRRFPRATFFADPSQPAHITQIAQARVRIFPAKNDREDGVSAVADRLVQRTAAVTCDRHRSSFDGLEECPFCRQVSLPPRLFVAPSCRNLIKEMGLYRRKRGREKDSYTDAIQDGNDHCLDSLRYLAFTRFGAPVVTRSTPDGHVA